MDQAEASGKTVDDALSRALKMIGASRDDLEAERVEMTVLDEGRKGMFGVGSREARVSVQRVGAAPAGEPGAAESRPPREGGRGQRGGGRAQGGEPRPQRQGGEPRQGGEARQGGDRPERGERAPRNGGDRSGTRAPRGGRDRRPAHAGYEQATPKLTEADFLKAPTFDEPAGAEPGPIEKRQQRSSSDRPQQAPRDRDRGRGRGGDAGSGAPRGERRRRDEDGPKVDPDINSAEVDFAAHVVDDLLRLLDINAELTLREPLTAGDGLGSVRAVIDINGDDLGLLIGRRGDTLMSLQYLVNLVVTRQYPEGPGVSIDVEHYRHRRETQVMALAQRMADRVRQTGNPITLEPMPASERRLIHLALADDPELETNSIGDGENRKVVISTRR
ncbi:MAG: Jag N-terminal domain-containing protein [Dehalococcoidia bacterium]|nr:Jag N-terminal domain-containing protein [Dehalococcoidia bacterium]